jgi:hypothetical protein
VLSALDQRGFVTEQQLEEIRSVLGEIIRNQIESGAARPGVIFR